MLEVTSAAAETSLVTIEQLRAAAGLSDGDTSRDDELALLGKAASADIVTACRVAIGNGAPPTLRRETFRQTFRVPQGAMLVLARRHEVTILSITADGTLLEEDAFEVSEESGLVRRYHCGEQIGWRNRRVIVEFEAGFDGVPADLAAATLDLVRVRLAEAEQNPLVRGHSTEVPGVLSERTDYWVGALPGADRGPVPPHISRRLTRYFNVRTW